MELRYLTYFVAVAEEKHFGRAAQRLRVSQPALSQQVRALESELKVVLLRRTTRSVELTPAGRAYLERATAVLRSVERAADEVWRVAEGVSGNLTLGCVGSATYSLLPQVSRALGASLPDVELAFRGEMLVPDQIEALKNGEIDIGLLRTPVLDESVTTALLRTDRLVVALPSDHRLADRRQIRLADLGGVDLIVHSADRRSTMYDVVLGLFREAQVPVRVRHEVGETSTAITLVAGGLGLAIVPEPAMALALDGVSFKPLVRPTRRVALSIAYNAQRHDPVVLRATEIIKRVVADASRN